MRLARLALATAVGGAVLWAQGSAAPDRANAYFHYSVAHMYAQMAADSQGAERTAYIDQAVDHYKQAIAADPQARQISEELVELYLQFDPRRGRDDAEATLRANPNDVAAHRLLARIYLRQASNTRNNTFDTAMLRRAMEEYETVTRLDPQDAASWVMLGRLYSALENRSAAEQAFEKALEAEPDNEDALVGLAAVYSDRGDAARAAELLKRAADKTPTAAALIRLATAYEEMKEFALAAETLRKALEMNPPDAGAVREKRAEYLINAGQYEEAAAVYEDIARDEPDDAGPQVQLSRLYLQMGDVAKARAASDRAKAIDGNDIEVRYNEVNVLQAEGRLPEAIGVLENVLSSTKRTAYNADQSRVRSQLLQHLAGLNLEIERTDAAVAAYRELIDLNPNLAPSLTADIINAYRSGKAFDKAQQEADAAIKRWPNDREIAVARANLQADLGQDEQAARAVRPFLDGTNDRAFYMTLAGIYEKGKRWAEVAAALDAAEKLSRTDIEKYVVYFQRGAMYEKMKDIVRAEEQFRKCLELFPDDPGALNYLGYMLADRDMRLAEALEMIQKAVKKQPGNGAYLDSLGWVYYRMGRFSEAEEQIRRATELMPSDPTMHDHYGDVLMRQSKVREAIAAWEESLRRWQASAPADKDAALIEQVRGKLDQARGRLNGRQ
jgi:tetratricopeptide (TPR) repeat protein